MADRLPLSNQLPEYSQADLPTRNTGRVVQPSAKIKVPASPVNMQIIDADQNSLGDGITGYIASVAVAGVMLNNGLISKREFLALEKQFLEKYGIPENVSGR